MALEDVARNLERTRERKPSVTWRCAAIAGAVVVGAINAYSGLIGFAAPAHFGEQVADPGVRPAHKTEELKPIPPLEYKPSPTIRRYVPSPTIQRYVPSPTLRRYVPSPTIQQYVPSPTIQQYGPPRKTASKTP
jgi:hypothetical protein